MPVLWIAGNHDCWGGDFLSREVGVRYHLGPWSGEVAGWRTRIDHGDGLRAREDRADLVAADLFTNEFIDESIGL